MTLQGLEAMYFRLAELTGYRSDIGSSEESEEFYRRLTEAEAYARKRGLLIGDVLAGVRGD